MSHQSSMKLSCIPISFQYIINHPTIFHMYTMPNSSIPTYKPSNTCKFTHFMFYHNNPTKHMANTQEQRRKQDLGTFSPSSRSGWKASLRREGLLAQASSFRLGESSKNGNNGLLRSLA